MSGGNDVPSFDESISSFSQSSSIGSDITSVLSKYQIEHEKTRKLEDKLAGYRTVAQQLPKFQGTITELKKRDEDREKEIAYYRTKDAEQEKKILDLEKQLKKIQEKQGLTDLDGYHRTQGSSSQTNSSPSFEIIGKYPYSNGGDRDKHLQQQESFSLSQSANFGTVVYNSCANRNTTLPYQQQAQHIVTSSSTYLTQPTVKSDVTTIGGAVDPQNNIVGLLRGFSSSTPAREPNFNFSDVNQLHSYPATKRGGIVSVLVSGTKKPIWQMEQEAAKRKMELSQTAQQNPPVSVASTQSGQNWGNFMESYETSKPVVSDTYSASLIQVGASDTGTRPKEWKAMNILSPPHSNVKPGDSSASQPDIKIPEKIADNLGYELIGGSDSNLSRLNQTYNLNNLNLSGKMTESQMVTSPLVEVTSSSDMMKFPSLNTNSPSPVLEKNNITPVTGPIYSQANSAILLPTDEQPNLVNQVESFAAILEKNDSPIEMSDMLYKFAENAKNMESKLNEYKVLVQRQQAQIHQLQYMPSFSKDKENLGLREENTALKNENESLLEFIAALKGNIGTEIDPGWISFCASQNNTDPVRAHYPDSPMMRKIESLSNINAKLFQANKDWHNKWEDLRQQTQGEKSALETKVMSLETMNKKLQESVASLEKDLQLQTASAHDLVKVNDSFEDEKSTLQRVNEALNTQLQCLKTEVKDLTRNKKMLESELAGLKSTSRSKDSQQAGNKELQTNISLLKQQLTIFAEDFEKERKDRLIAESKVDKFRKECDQIKLSLETKLKKMNVQMRTLENDLRTKARLSADLMYQVDDLKLKLQHEQRKTALMTSQSAYSFAPPPASYQGPVSMPYNSDVNGHLTNTNIGPVNHLFANNITSAGFTHQSSPEHLPGAWKCKHCTYVNYPSRSVCDICGYTNSNGESLPIAESGSGRNELQSRGEERRWRDTDVVSDTL